MPKLQEMLRDLFNALLFVVLAGGGNFLLYNALFLQIPYFQQHQPEGLCLATWMIVSTNLSVPVVYFFYLLDHYFCSFSIDRSLIAMMAITSTTAISLAFHYSISVNNISWALLIGSFVSGVIGYLGFQITYPVLARFEEKYAMAARSDILTIALALVVFYQNPGSPTVEFSPGAFLLGVGIFLLICPPLAYAYVTYCKIGLKEKFNSTHSNPEFQMISGFEDRETQPIISKPEDDHYNFVFEIFCICWVEVNVYGILLLLLPFIFSKNSSNGEDGSVYLSYALNITYPMNVIGQFLVYWYRLPDIVSLSMFTVALVFMYLSLVVDWFHGQSWILLISYCVVSFSSQYIMQCTWNSIFALPAEKRNRGAKLVGAWDSIFVFFGSLLGLFITSSYFDCFR